MPAEGHPFLTYGAAAVLGRLPPGEALVLVRREGPWECAEWLHTLLLDGQINDERREVLRQARPGPVPERDGLVFSALATVSDCSEALEVLRTQATRAPGDVASCIVRGLQRVVRFQSDKARPWREVLLAEFIGHAPWRRRVADLVLNITGLEEPDIFVVGEETKRRILGRQEQKTDGRPLLRPRHHTPDTLLKFVSADLEFS